MYSLGIVGSRNINDYTTLKTVLDPHKHKIKRIVSGGAIGVDRLARKYADENDIKLIEHIPDWDKFGKSAGYRRNTLIVEDSDIGLILWDGKSKGTKHSIDLFIKQNKPHKIIYF